MKPSVHWVPTVDGVEIAVHDHGGEGPSLVFCHATGLHARVWDPVIASLRERYRCIALDQRGHGDSRCPPETSFEWTRSADDLLAVVDALSLQAGVRMVGHSFGGCVILLAEQRRPGTVGAAWVCEPIVFPRTSADTDNANPLATLARRRREVFESKAAASERLTGRGPFVRTRADALAAYVEHGFRTQADGSVILKCRGETEARVFEGSTGNDAFERLGEVACPVTVAVSGDGDPPSLVGEAVAAALPAGRLERWPELTHFLPLEEPERVADAISIAVR